MVTLFICFVSAVVFQFDDVHETHCRVRVSFDWFGLLTPFYQHPHSPPSSLSMSGWWPGPLILIASFILPFQVFNFIPSISAITGISPNIYFWRISIALHVGPRFIIAICYKSYYEHMLCHVKNPTVHSKGTLYMKLAFWLHLVEITSLCGVTYISNRENYSKCFDINSLFGDLHYYCYYDLTLKFILVLCLIVHFSFLFFFLFLFFPFCSPTRASVHCVYAVLVVPYADRYKAVSIIEEWNRCTAITPFNHDRRGEIH